MHGARRHDDRLALTDTDNLYGLWPFLAACRREGLTPIVGAEFMPELFEGDLMYMPTTLPGLSIGKAQELLQQTDRLIKQVPEVKQVFGKIGRAETATDPAPLTMIETVIQLKPREEWREGMTPEDLRAELDRVVQYPGLTNAWVMPIKTRIDMLATGIKTPVGIKVAGPDLEVSQDIGTQIEEVMRDIPGTASAYSERVAGGRYVVVDIDRVAASRFGLNIADVQEVVSTAVGGMQVSQTLEGLERYPINLRYPRELRDNPQALREIHATNPEALMFGTDLPSTRAERPYSDSDFGLVIEALGADAAREVFHGNAARFYRSGVGFTGQQQDRVGGD